jgi:hypothetical protein
MSNLITKKSQKILRGVCSCSQCSFYSFKKNALDLAIKHCQQTGHKTRFVSVYIGNISRRKNLSVL